MTPTPYGSNVGCKIVGDFVDEMPISSTHVGPPLVAQDWPGIEVRLNEWFIEAGEIRQQPTSKDGVRP